MRALWALWKPRRRRMEWPVTPAFRSPQHQGDLPGRDGTELKEEAKGRFVTLRIYIFRQE